MSGDSNQAQLGQLRAAIMAGDGLSRNSALRLVGIIERMACRIDTLERHARLEASLSILRPLHDPDNRRA